MKTRKEFIDAFVDEVSGFLLCAFTMGPKQDFAARGNFLEQKLGQMRPLLARMWDFIADLTPAPITHPPTTEELADRFLANWSKEGEKMLPAERQQVIDRFRSAFKAKTDEKKPKPEENGKVAHSGK